MLNRFDLVIIRVKRWLVVLLYANSVWHTVLFMGMNDFTSCTWCFGNVSLSEVSDVEIRGRIVVVHYRHVVCGNEGGQALSVRVWHRVQQDELISQLVASFAADLEGVVTIEDLERI